MSAPRYVVEGVPIPPAVEAEGAFAIHEYVLAQLPSDHPTRGAIVSDFAREVAAIEQHQPARATAERARHESAKAERAAQAARESDVPARPPAGPPASRESEGLTDE
jgi:hypothetical protein